MYLAKVIGKVVSTIKHPAYQDRKLMLVQPVTPDNEPMGRVTIAVDCVGAGEGETVIVSGAPGGARQVFGIKRAPIRELIIGIVDSVQAAPKQ